MMSWKEDNNTKTIKKIVVIDELRNLTAIFSFFISVLCICLIKAWRKIGVIFGSRLIWEDVVEVNLSG